MPFALLFLGLMLISVGAQGTQAQLGTQLETDFSGAGSFWYYIIGLFLCGLIGYYQPLKGASRLFLGLIILVLLLSNQGFWSQLQTALSSPTAATAPTTPTPQPNLIGASNAAGIAATAATVGGAALTTGGSSAASVGPAVGTF